MTIPTLAAIKEKFRALFTAIEMLAAPQNKYNDAFLKWFADLSRDILNREPDAGAKRMVAGARRGLLSVVGEDEYWRRLLLYAIWRARTDPNFPIKQWEREHLAARYGGIT